MRFPYVKFRGKLAPIIPVKFKKKGKEEWLEVGAYVDSGARYSVFHLYVAEILGLKLEKGKEDYVMVRDGSQIKVYLHQVRIQLATKEFGARVAFSRHLGIGFNIIGRLDIFNRFKICFDETEKFIEFRPKV